MRCKAATPSDEIDDLVVAIHWFERAQSEQHRARVSVEGTQQREERTRRNQITTIRTNVDTGQRSFLEAFRDDPINIQ